MRVVVTGAGGYIGRHLAGHLAGRGHAIVPLTHGDWDLTSGVSPAALLADCDAVVHLAGRVHVRGRAADAAFGRAMVETNVRGTERLAGAAADVGVRRFVFISTSTVYGRATAGRTIDESTPLNPETAYGESKAAAEEALRTIAASTGLETIALRPPPVYGPGMAGNLRSLLQFARRGLPMPSGALGARRSFVSVTNFCALIVAALEVAHPARFAYVAGEPARPIGDVYGALCTAYGRRPRIVPMPRAVLRMGLAVIGRGALAGALLDDFMMDSSAARSELGWAPQDLLADELYRATAEARRA